jgi:hypothetical protein
MAINVCREGRTDLGGRLGFGEKHFQGLCAMPIDPSSKRSVKELFHGKAVHGRGDLKSSVKFGIDLKV